MPTLFRFVTVIVILFALVYAAMFALATFVSPRQTQMVVPVPIEQLDRNAVSSPKP
ncbi:histidine kinase [Tianweitania sp.]|uniref:histidine kinase n=1 Tax=Tianweitania sp. TaxID=2021634 RepID=UPI002898A839|nr:histidine kinase [Tianweitania sp.]